MKLFLQRARQLRTAKFGRRAAAKSALVET